ncbi:GDT1-like protein 1, chloroplastic [Panicum miliaceum]|uniref:GDT1 family protein n=1 Tax=Panicum miliaceum TaxID=4540 RepID=A0A3L6QXP9_PANMI|nr:GDT1-like protein 1, chloroplastic [Panicum miliaceum]
MASVAASCSCSTVFASSSATPIRTRAPRPSLRTPPRRGRLPLPGRSVLRCLKSGERPPVGGGTGLSVRKAAEPAAGQGRSRAAPFDASCGIAFATVAGVLVLQGTQQTMAATQFGGLQPADVLGDLGDISTGDRTFFIAALLAARNSGAVIFLGTFGALSVMTIISVVLGRAFHYVDGIIPFGFGGTDFPVDDIAAACLLVYYGVTTLLDAASGDDEKINEEQEEAELAVSKFSGNGAGVMSAAALAAASSPLGVIAGSLAGHAVATLIAVLGGSLLGTFLSEKKTAAGLLIKALINSMSHSFSKKFVYINVTEMKRCSVQIIAYIGGSLFLAFAAITIVEIVT